MFFVSTSILAKVWSPYTYRDPEALEHDKAYCKSPDEEKKLWIAIGKYSESFLDEAPQIPPEQKAYISGELQSGNSDRLHRILQSSIYRINSIRGSSENLKSLSSDYLKYHKNLPIEKKTEFVGRSLINILDDEFEHDDIERIVSDLRTKNYFISSEALRTYWAVNRTLRRTLVYQLICYGENYNKPKK